MSKVDFYSLDRVVVGFGFLLVVIFIAPLSLGLVTYGEEESSELSLRSKLAQVPDSFQLGNIVVYNLFKDQILANTDGAIDSQRIVNNVYRRHRVLWDECIGAMFGSDNEAKFRSDPGMVSWNQSSYLENKAEFDSLAELLIEQNIDSVFTFHAARFEELGYPMPTARVSLAFTLFTGIGFGGCANDQFVYELNNPEFDIPYTVTAGIPHELYHFINAEQSPQLEEWRAIDLTINEGLACYFVYDYFGGKMPKHEAVEAMTAEEWQYYIDHEVEIYEKLNPHFGDTSGDNPLLQNDEYQLFPGAPQSLHYWLGFRIVERYLETHPEVSIKDLTSMSYAEILAGSTYEAKILELAETK